MHGSQDILHCLHGHGGSRGLATRTRSVSCGGGGTTAILAFRDEFHVLLTVLQYPLPLI
jgi:hypothetical protein